MKISCIIVNYNKSEYLCRSIDSVINQTVKVDEIIIADDCSTDDSRQIIKKYAEEYEFIKPIFRKKNLGVAKNRDLAIRQADGDYITTLDSDDCFMPRKIEFESIALKNTVNSIAFSNIILIKSNYEKEILITKDFSNVTKDKLVEMMFSRHIGIPRDMLFPKKIYMKFGGFKSYLHLYEDWDFKLFLACQNSEWLHSNYNGIAYYEYENSLSRKNIALHLIYKLIVIVTNIIKCNYKKSAIKGILKLLLKLFNPNLRVR